jgi:hypothetical protein
MLCDFVRQAEQAQSRFSANYHTKILKSSNESNPFPEGVTSNLSTRKRVYRSDGTPEVAATVAFTRNH